MINFDIENHTRRRLYLLFNIFKKYLTYLTMIFKHNLIYIYINEEELIN